MSSEGKRFNKHIQSDRLTPAALKIPQINPKFNSIWLRTFLNPHPSNTHHFLSGQDVGFPLHARLILHRCLVSVALIVALVPYQITSLSCRSHLASVRKEVSVFVWMSHTRVIDFKLWCEFILDLRSKPAIRMRSTWQIVSYQKFTNMWKKIRFHCTVAVVE